VIESWRKHDNNVRPHSSFGYHPPAPEVVLWPAKPALAPKPIMHQHSTPTTPWGQTTG
jgi:putative transposase